MRTEIPIFFYILVEGLKGGGGSLTCLRPRDLIEPDQGKVEAERSDAGSFQKSLPSGKF